MDTRTCVAVVVRNIRENSNEAHLRGMEQQGYDVRFVQPGDDPLPAIEEFAPAVTCFQFDHPDLRGLAELRMTKERLPSTPLIMITQAHSESLAVWAFRTRVWDYFVQPVDLERFLAVIGYLARLRSTSGSRQGSAPGGLMPTNSLPPEVRMRGAEHQAGDASLEPALSFVNRNLHRKIIQSEVAEMCGLSPFQFSRLFKKQYQVTFQAYVLHKRITEAMRMLHHPRATVTDVCFNVGFSDLSYFARAFQRQVGTSPSQYRQTVTSARTRSPAQQSSGGGERRLEARALPPLGTVPDLPEADEGGSRRASARDRSHRFTHSRGTGAYRQQGT